LIDPEVQKLDDIVFGSHFSAEAHLGIREAINRHSAISTTVIICAIVVGVVTIGVELRGDNGKPPSKNYFTIDDGKTWFADSSSKLPPFDHGGAVAVRCYVFKGSNGKFAGLLEKYSDDTRERLARWAQQVPQVPLRNPPPILVKKPGEKDWKSVGPDQEAMILMHDISGPDGSAAERVMP
jgi:hypothetical protein